MAHTQWVLNRFKDWLLYVQDKNAIPISKYVNIAY